MAAFKDNGAVLVLFFVLLAHDGVLRLGTLVGKRGAVVRIYIAVHFFGLSHLILQPLSDIEAVVLYAIYVKVIVF